MIEHYFTTIKTYPVKDVMLLLQTMLPFQSWVSVMSASALQDAPSNFEMFYMYLNSKCPYSQSGPTGAGGLVVPSSQMNTVAGSPFQTSASKSTMVQIVSYRLVTHPMTPPMPTANLARTPPSPEHTWPPQLLPVA
jgi:hypothetical protein